MSQKYRDLMKEYVEGRIDAAAFERSYLELHRAVGYDTISFPAIHEVFTAVDCLCLDPELFDKEWDITANELLKTVVEQLAVLDSIAATSHDSGDTT